MKKYKVTPTKDQYYFIKETTTASILADTYMWVSMCWAFWLNYTFIDWNNFLDFIIFIMLWLYIVWLFKKINRFDTKEEIIDFLNK